MDLQHLQKLHRTQRLFLQQAAQQHRLLTATKHQQQKWHLQQHCSCKQHRPFLQKPLLQVQLLLQQQQIRFLQEAGAAATRVKAAEASELQLSGSSNDLLLHALHEPALLLLLLLEAVKMIVLLLRLAAAGGRAPWHDKSMCTFTL
jgi:RecB family endonuclease NucS